MIQRIQTVFLLLALAATLSFFFFPFGYIITKDASQIEVYTTGMQFNGEKIHSDYSLLPLFIMIIIINLVTFISIFLYKRRMLQIRLNIFNLILQLGSIGVSFYFLTNAAGKFGTDYSTSILIILPAVAFIFTFLAIRAIARDEALVQSLNRLR
ncbi:MAG: DUF4293 domain-containing protein [Bacteroidales bacterium]|nr:DUF4293 domain-containing protein [Bacteroidales bacterium]HOL98689.1 DUF4293 domain-containing protein [Bacteroidales bacterium]HOM37130.1 DUF4293 domain-containing protein [Bacteroidales bacterium]HPD24782.1 DUF4293 domain-containing protein [Bacteroidales bacterium]HRT00528.1 DUF4293 domain-containing protein [Bacteroidales bacterium]